MNEQKPYRPHNPGHDYYAPGIYLVTLVVRGREALLGALNNDAANPGVLLSELGKAVHALWENTPEVQAAKGNHVKMHAQAVMPDHWHGVIEVCEPMNISLGHIMQLFKRQCTGEWRKITGYVESPYTTTLIRNLTATKRRAYYATRPRHEQPLWDDNYDDTICLTDPLTGQCCARHFGAMLRYVEDNPRRAIIRKQRPEYMRRVLHLTLAGRDYAAFGNLFLLRWPRRVQVFCHRKGADGRTPYEQTQAYAVQCEQWVKQVMEGATVIVTPGISAGERLMKNRCLECGYPLIHIQKEPIGPFWKPEQSRFEACVSGALLILAPWKPEELGDVRHVPQESNYATFHNLNRLAEEICNFEGEAKIVGFVR